MQHNLRNAAFKNAHSTLLQCRERREIRQGPPAAQQHIGGSAHGIHIQRRLCSFKVNDLLWRHVHPGAGELAGAGDGEECVCVLLETARKVEIGNFGNPLTVFLYQQDAIRLQIAVDIAPLMKVFQPNETLGNQQDDFLWREHGLSFLADKLAQVAARHEF